LLNYCFFQFLFSQSIAILSQDINSLADLRNSKALLCYVDKERFGEIYTDDCSAT